MEVSDQFMAELLERDMREQMERDLVALLENDMQKQMLNDIDRILSEQVGESELNLYYPDQTKPNHG